MNHYSSKLARQSNFYDFWSMNIYIRFQDNQLVSNRATLSKCSCLLILTVLHITYHSRDTEFLQKIIRTYFDWIS